VFVCAATTEVSVQSLGCLREEWHSSRASTLAENDDDLRLEVNVIHHEPR
jgi:hypothetical protein